MIRVHFTAADLGRAEFAVAADDADDALANLLAARAPPYCALSRIPPPRANCPAG
ncbi:hypothetical protein [Kribbella sp. NPDC048915]|uniref:hypothetical protein n=1 Tax=Kribbella sp. NPDC048915 TaxID=3155148 RepID=UPI0033D088AE